MKGQNVPLLVVILVCNKPVPRCHRGSLPMNLSYLSRICSSWNIIYVFTPCARLNATQPSVLLIPFINIRIPLCANISSLTLWIFVNHYIVIVSVRFDRTIIISWYNFNVAIIFNPWKFHSRLLLFFFSINNIQEIPNLRFVFKTWFRSKLVNLFNKVLWTVLRKFFKCIIFKNRFLLNIIRVT